MRYRINNLFLTTSVYFCNTNLELIPNVFLWMLKKKRKNFWNFFIVFKCALLKKPKLFSEKGFIIFFTHPWKMRFLLYNDFLLTKNYDLFWRNFFFDVENLKIHMQFNLDRICCVCSVGHRQTKYKEIFKIIYYFFLQTSMKNAIGISSRYLLQKCTDVVMKRWFIL